jgi:hypothetical protein
MSLSPNYAPPNETSAQIWDEVSHLHGETTLGGWTYGKQDYHS